MAERKDFWDKLDVISRAAVPLVVAVSVYLWNQEKSNLHSAATMTSIAVGVLSKEPETAAVDDALRDWAVEVLLNPTSVTPLSEEAAKELRSDGVLLKWHSYYPMDGPYLFDVDIRKFLEAWKEGYVGAVEPRADGTIEPDEGGAVPLPD